MKTLKFKDKATISKIQVKVCDLDEKGVKDIRTFYQEMKRVDKAITDMMISIPGSETDLIKEFKAFHDGYDKLKRFFFSKYKSYLK